MTRKQLNAYEVIVRARNGSLTVAEAAEVLGVSERHIKRLKKKVKEEGAAALVHKNSLRTPAHALTQC
ncbi:MAG: helix-turn-helix domain-containing protein [Clostridiales Family XIII bacterium]|jgi:transposase|nr:helix-turn-helix domain-containing protein [Clostridiales Family XIII bacterium]